MTLCQNAQEVFLFFALSKTLGIMLLPTNFLIGLSLLGAVLLFTRFVSFGRKLVLAGIVLLAICGFSPLGYLLLYPLEARFPPWDETRGAPDGIIVLGGSIEPEFSAAHGVTVFKGSVDRIIAAAALAHRYPKARLVFSGGSANLVADDSAKEADYAVSVFERLGIARDRLTMERRSRNTQENDEFSKALASPKPGHGWPLVAAAFHVRTSVVVFRKAGFIGEPYPADWRTGSGRTLWAPSTFA